MATLGLATIGTTPVVTCLLIVSDKYQNLQLRYKTSDGRLQYTLVDCRAIDTRNCVLCENLSTEDQTVFLTPINIWAFLEIDSIFFKHAEDTHFVCSLCLADQGISDRGQQVANRKGTPECLASGKKLCLRRRMPLSALEDTLTRKLQFVTSF